MLRNLTLNVLACALAWSMTTAAVAQPPAPLDRAASPQEVKRFKQAIRKLYDLKEKAWAAGDAESIVMKFYAADAISAGEGDPEYHDRPRRSFVRLTNNTSRTLQLVRIESVRTDVNGNAGWDWANFYSDAKPDKKSMYPPSPIRIRIPLGEGKWPMDLQGRYFRERQVSEDTGRRHVRHSALIQPILLVLITWLLI